MSQPKYTPIYSSLGKKIGRVEGGIFYKSIRGSKHMLRKPPGLAVDLMALMDAEQAGAIRILITDNETGIKYSTAISHLKRAGFTFDRGAGRQIALALESFIQERPGAPVQLALFGGRAR
jgi:hypothetical protein